jgi:hypothetical protein
MASKSAFHNKSKPSGIVKVDNREEEDIKLNANDTDFLLKLFMDSSFKGSEVDKAHNVLSKLAKIHRSNLNG